MKATPDPIQRRLGIEKLVRQSQRENPHMSLAACKVRAKLLWTEKHGGKKQ